MDLKKIRIGIIVYFFFMLLSLLLELFSNDIKEVLKLNTPFVFGIIKLVIYIFLIVKLVYFFKINRSPFIKYNSWYLLVFFILSALAYYNTQDIINQKQYDISEFKQILYTSFCFLIGLNEEFLFRLLLFYLIINAFLKYTSNALFKTILITSLLFSLAHIQNIFSMKNILSVLNQILLAYSLGIIFQVILIRTKNIFTVVFLHGIFDYYGMRNSKLFKIMPQDNSGFTTTEVIVNISVFILIALFLTFLCYKFCKKQYDKAEVFREQKLITT